MAPARGKRALALGGGGFTGYLFEIGALTALDDLVEDGTSMNDLDLYVGVSAGAAAASLIANGVTPGEILETNLSGTRPYYFDHRNVFSPAIGEGLKTVWRVTRQLIPLLKLYVRHYREMTLIDLLDKAQDALPSGIYTLEPFAAYLSAIFRARKLSDTFAGLAKELYIPAIDLETGEGVMFGDEGWREVPISRAVTASSAVPIYFCPVRIQGRDYIDAGIGRMAFFEIAVHKHVDFMIMINPMARAPQRRSLPGGTAERRVRERGFLSIGEQASRINFDARFSHALERFQHDYPDKEVLVISPVEEDALLFERSFLSYRDRIHLLRAGYMSVTMMARDRFEELSAQFARHGVALSRMKFEERARGRLAGLDPAGTVVVPRAPQSVAAPARVGGVGVAWRKAK
ncbi:MAG: patatin-like phospholipase family protein [Nitrospira sp.]|uniref:PNPLA domain-containing protein n=1 Tax=Nitrospira defluvii TaxID=330214 RepID=A0ABM8R318_9BACT|nr:patatin-like phospholipase family protein [Nitrospira defluvii]MCS6329016.1 patatin-like phospholipase family protein [Nitrospira sp.]CAE6730243.1 PNPLA domain-containing protein [Nitrospira defluvii]